MAVRKPELAAVRCVVGDAERLPYRDGSFDAVVSIGVFQYLPDPEGALKEGRRVAVDAGQLRLVAPMTPTGRIRAVLAQRLAFTVSPASATRACHRAGWGAVEVRPVSMDWLARDALVVTARAVGGETNARGARSASERVDSRSTVTAGRVPHSVVVPKAGTRPRGSPRS